MAPPALRPSGSSSRTRPTRLIIPLTAALAALFLTLRYGELPGPGEAPILDLIALEDPLAQRALRVWHFAAPAFATLSLGCLAVRYATPLRPVAGRAAAFALDHFVSAAATANHLLSRRLVIAISRALGALAWSVAMRPFPAPGDVPILDLIELEDPGFYAVIRAWYPVIPPLVAFGGVMVLTTHIASGRIAQEGPSLWRRDPAALPHVARLRVRCAYSGTSSSPQ